MDYSYEAGRKETREWLEYHYKDPKAKHCNGAARRMLKIAIESAVGSHDRYWHGSADELRAYLGE